MKSLGGEYLGRLPFQFEFPAESGASQIYMSDWCVIFTPATFLGRLVE